MKYFNKFVAFVAFLATFAFAVSAASADVFTDTGTSTSATATTDASQQPVAANDTSKLLACTKSYGNVALEDRSFPALPVHFARVGVPATMLASVTNHASKQAGCFDLVGKGAPGSQYILRVQMGAPRFASSIDKKDTATVGALGLIPGFGRILASQATRNVKVNVFFSEAYVAMTIINVATGETVSSAEGFGKINDVSLGVALLSAKDVPSDLTGEAGQNISTQVIATAFADAFNKLVPYMDKLDAGTPMVPANSTAATVASAAQ